MWHMEMGLGLKRGDHLCGFYETSEEKNEILCRFVIEGLRLKERMVILSEGGYQETLPGALSREGLDVPSLLKEKNLVILSPRETFLRIKPLMGSHRNVGTIRSARWAGFLACAWAAEPHGFGGEGRYRKVVGL
jgi:hypothetical protein